MGLDFPDASEMRINRIQTGWGKEGGEGGRRRRRRRRGQMIDEVQKMEKLK